MKYHSNHIAKLYKLTICIQVPASESKLFGKNNPDAYKDKVDAGKSINA